MIITMIITIYDLMCLTLLMRNTLANCNINCISSPSVWHLGAFINSCKTQRGLHGNASILSSKVQHFIWSFNVIYGR